MDWVLLRGLARESAHWGDLPDRLRQARPGDRFHTLDLPGTGRSRHLRSPGRIEEMRRFAQQATGHLPRPLGLVGLSLGGMVALDWAVQHPRDIAALVLISTSSGLSAPWHRLRPAQWVRVMRMLTQTDSDARERAILAISSNRPVSEPVAAQWSQIQRERPVRRLNVIRQLYAASRYRPPRQPIKLPALLLASRKDRLTDWRCSLRLAQAWSWPVEVHPSAGHDLPLDDPQWVIHQINAYFPATGSGESNSGTDVMDRS